MELHFLVPALHIDQNHSLSLLLMVRWLPSGQKINQQLIFIWLLFFFHSTASVLIYNATFFLNKSANLDAARIGVASSQLKKAKVTALALSPHHGTHGQ